MKLAFMVNNRNKEKYIRMAVRSILFQKCEPFLAVLSDNNSTDASKAIMDEEAAKYDGPHKVVRLNCPVFEHDGMAGLNAHMDWVMDQIDADWIIQLSGDDYSLEHRAQKTLDAFRANDPSMVLTAQYSVSEDMKYVAETAYPHMDGWVRVEDVISKYVGGSCSQAWSREFYEKMGGVRGCLGSPDILMPLLSILHKGCYYLNERLQCYRKVLGPDNTGLESIYFDVPESDLPKRKQLEELIHFQVIVGLYEVLGKMYDAKLETRPAEEALSLAISDRAASLVRCRKDLSFMRVPPLPFKV